VGREVEVLRSNILRIIEDESFLEELRREFKKYFDTANSFVKQYYRVNRRLPMQMNVYWVLRKSGAPSTTANEVSKKVLESWKGYIELKKYGYKTRVPEFKNTPIILHNEQYRVYAVRERDKWIAEKIEFSLNRKWVSLRVRGKLRWVPELKEGLVFYMRRLKYPIIELRHCLVDNYLILGEKCFNKNRAEIFRRNGKWYFAFSVSLKIPRLKGKGIAGVDIGARNLVALCGVSDSGESFSVLFKSGTLRSYWLKCEKLARRRNRIAHQYFWEAVKCAESGDKEREKECFSKYRLFLRKTGRFRKKAKEVRKKAVNSMCRLIAEFFASKGISIVYIGNSVCYCVSREDLVKEITSKPTRELLRNFFAPRQIIDSLRRHCEVKGIQVIEVGEKGTSSICPVCGQRIQRPYRGLVVCEKCGQFNADLVAAYNIMKFNSSVELNDKELKRLLNNPKTYIYLVKEQKWIPKN